MSLHLSPGVRAIVPSGVGLVKAYQDGPGSWALDVKQLDTREKGWPFAVPAPTAEFSNGAQQNGPFKGLIGCED